MRSNFDDVGHFHEKFDLDNATFKMAGPREAPERLLQFRYNFLNEELTEFHQAMGEDDVVGMADALIDLVYVAMGTAHLLGLPWQDLWDEVQHANMSKIRATTDLVGPRGNAEFDVVKGKDFEPPDIESVLRRHGFDV